LLRAAIAAHSQRFYGQELDPMTQIGVTCGATEAIFAAVQALTNPGDEVVLFEPFYDSYLASVQMAQAVPRYVRLRAPDAAHAQWWFDDAELVAAFSSKTRLVIVNTPNNPTGTPVSNAAIAAAYDATDGMVFVDEAYAEFAPVGSDTALDLLAGRPRLIVSRTMSKAFAFAGARVGYLAADPAVVDAMRLVRLPYHLSALTQAAAVGALAHAPEMLAMVEDIKTQRDRLERELTTLGYTPYPSSANFVLFGNVASPNDTFEKLLAQGIIIRDVGIENHLRVTAGTEQETGEFLAALAALNGTLT
jgi:histidinol-phosphate aminotransferase